MNNLLNPAPDFIPDESGQAGCTTCQGGSLTHEGWNAHLFC